VLPARFAWLPGTVTIVLGREPPTLAGISTAATAAAIAVAVAIPVKSPAAATAAATAASSRPATTATGCGFGPRLIHFQRTPADFLAVQAGHGLGGFGIVGHFDKRESAGASGFAVHGDMDASDLTERFKEGAQLRFRRLKIHVPDKHVLHKFLSFKEWESAERAASLTGFRSLEGDSEDRMKSRGFNLSRAPEGEGKPDSHFKHNNYIRV
jgi:hypothetical protein